MKRLRLIKECGDNCSDELWAFGRCGLTAAAERFWRVPNCLFVPASGDNCKVGRRRRDGPRLRHGGRGRRGRALRSSDGARRAAYPRPAPPRPTLDPPTRGRPRGFCSHPRHSTLRQKWGFLRRPSEPPVDRRRILRSSRPRTGPCVCGLDHELARQMRRRRRFQRMQDDRPIQPDRRTYRPVVKPRLEHMAWPCVKARRSVSKPKESTAGRNALTGVKRRPWFRRILHAWPRSPPRGPDTDGLHAVGRALDVY